MAVPTLITDLSTTPASNSPAGSENVFPNLDDYLRVQSAFLASIRDNSGNGWVSPYLATTWAAAPGPIGGTTPNAISGTTGTFSGDVQMASLNGGAISLRNKVINGNMGIAQRGTTAVTTGATYGPADRWVTGTAGNTFSTTQGSFVSGDTLYDTGGAQYFTQVAVTSVAGASNSTDLSHKIEDVRLLAGKTVTVSFWAKAASGTPSIGVEVRQNFGTGGSPSAAVTGTGQAQALTTTWAQYSKTFTVPSINGKTLGTTANTSFTQLVFWLDAGSSLNTVSGSIGQSSKTVSIAQVQLEVGSVATPFEQRPYGMELALCQRYFYAYTCGTSGAGDLGIGYLRSTTSFVTSIKMPVPLRVAPTAITFSGAVGDYTYQAGGTTCVVNGIAAVAYGPDSSSVEFTSATASTLGFGGRVYGLSGARTLYFSGSEL